MVEKIDFTYDLKKIVDLFELAEKEAEWSQSFPTVQSGIQTTVDNNLDFLSSCRPRVPKEEERKYLTLNKLYQNSYLEEFLNNSPVKICRLRWMILHPKSCYTLHKDETRRIHIPLKTNSQCYLIFQGDGNFYHLNLGEAYVLDTTKPHTAMNGGEELRIHLVGCIYE